MRNFLAIMLPILIRSLWLLFLWGLSMYLIERELKEFAAAHRLGKGYQGKCQHLHGHNYRVVVLLAGEQLDGYDFLIDFNDIKSLFDVWLQQNWDQPLYYFAIPTLLPVIYLIRVSGH